MAQKNLEQAFTADANTERNQIGAAFDEAPSDAHDLQDKLDRLQLGQHDDFPAHESLVIKLTEERDTLKQQLEEAKKIASNVEAERDTLRGQLSRALHEHEELKAEASAANIAHEGERLNWQRQMDVQLSFAQTASDNATQHWRENVNVATEQLSDAMKELKRVSQELETSEQNLADEHDATRRAIEDARDLRSENLRLSQAASDMEHRLIEDSRAAQAKLQELAAEVEVLRVERNTLRSNIETEWVQTDMVAAAADTEQKELLTKFGRLLASYAGCDVAQPGWNRFADMALMATLEAPVTDPRRCFTVGAPWTDGADHAVLTDFPSIDTLLARLYARARASDCSSGAVVELEELAKMLSLTRKAVRVQLVDFVLFVWATQADLLTDTVLCAVRGLLAVVQTRWQVDQAKLASTTEQLFQRPAAQQADVRLVAQLLGPDGFDSLMQQTSTTPKADFIDLSKVSGVEAVESVTGWYWPPEKRGAILGEEAHLWLFDEQEMVIRKIDKSRSRLVDFRQRYRGHGDDMVEVDILDSTPIILKLIRQHW